MQKEGFPVLLCNMPKGQRCRVADISNPELRVQALRFGIGIGQKIQCVEILPFGPVIVRKNIQQIAIGRELAKAILVVAES